MSLHLSVRESHADGFPRVSGDEPVRCVGCELDDRFSPRERG